MFFSCSFSFCPKLSKAGTRDEDNFHSRMRESDWGANQMRERLYQDKSVHGRLDLRQRRVYSVPRCPFVSLVIVLLFFDTHCISFEKVGRFDTNYC